ncbi:MAG: YlmC/YmxH family sporulation protein [Bacillota bacterium]|nr:YlmC/YmxH family sporulation protein [Bacillota bacterium]
MTASTTIAELRYKEVVSLSNGARLGFVCDLEFDMENGRVTSLVIPGPLRFFGLLGREEDYIVPWDAINKIGEDIILVKYEPKSSKFRSDRLKNH